MRKDILKRLAYAFEICFSLILLLYIVTIIFISIEDVFISFPLIVFVFSIYFVYILGKKIDNVNTYLKEGEDIEDIDKKDGKETGKYIIFDLNKKDNKIWGNRYEKEKLKSKEKLNKKK